MGYRRYDGPQLRWNDVWSIPTRAVEVLAPLVSRRSVSGSFGKVLGAGCYCMAEGKLGDGWLHGVWRRDGRECCNIGQTRSVVLDSYFSPVLRWVFSYVLRGGILLEGVLVSLCVGSTLVAHLPGEHCAYHGCCPFLAGGIVPGVSVRCCPFGFGAAAGLVSPDFPRRRWYGGCSHSGEEVVGKAGREPRTSAGSSVVVGAWCMTIRALF